MIDLAAVPQPYYLSRGIKAAGDLAGAELGNFLVRAAARRVIETAAPGACKFYPTHEAKSKAPTDWFLAVPQAELETGKWPSQYTRCPECGAPKTIDHCEPLEFTSPAFDIFKSKQWKAARIGEETPWYLKDQLRMTKEQVPPGQWTRLNIHRELWFSTRLLLLLREQKLQAGSFLSSLHNRKALPAEAAWIAEQNAKLAMTSTPPAATLPIADAKTDNEQWLNDYLRDRRSAKPLATAEGIVAWEKKHKLTLPPAYVKFVTTVGRHAFKEVFGIEGYNVRIVGPKQMDMESYRRDPAESAATSDEPDGLMFAIAVNGDCLCFDLREKSGEYAVYHFNHETETFESFATDFVAALRRLAERD